MQLECWVNRELPEGPGVLAKVLGFQPATVERALREVSPFFTVHAGVIRCPELDNYRAYLDDLHRKRSNRGKAGAAKTNERRSRATPADPTGTPQASCGPLVKQSPAQSNTDKSLDEGVMDDPWLNDYERVSRGH